MTFSPLPQRVVAILLASSIASSALAQAPTGSPSAATPTLPAPAGSPGVVIVQETTPTQPGYAPYVATQPPFTPQMQRRRPSMSPLASSSLYLFGSFYAWSALSGAFALIIAEAGHDRCDHCRAVGRWFFLPVAGPLAAMHETDTQAGRRYCAVIGSLGVISFATFAIGMIVNRSRANRPVSLSVTPTAMSLSLRF